MRDPIVRASWSSGLVRFANAQPNPPKILAPGQLPEVESQLAGASGFAWLPFSVYDALIEAIAAEVGVDGLEALMADYVASLGSSSLYRPLLKGLDLFGNASLSMIRLYARGVGLSIRNAGHLTVAPLASGKGVHVTLSELPSECRGRAYAHGHKGALCGAFILVGSKGKATMDTSRLAPAGVIEFEVAET